MAFPSTLTAYTQTTASSKLNNPSHSGLHNTISSALGQVEAVVGVDGANSVLGTVIGDLRSPGSKGGGHVQGAAFGGTGQTTFTKGDVLIASSASVLTKLAVGTDGQSLKADSTKATGVTWGSGNTLPTVRVYSTPSILTWTKPSVLSYIVVKVVGGGGSGGGVGGASGGAGGGSGGYSEIKIVASNLGANVTVWVASSVTGSIGGIGITGKYSGFGSFASCAGGNGGQFGQGGNATATGGAGGAASLGDINIVGGTGAQGVLGGGSTTITIGGAGADSLWGQGGAQVLNGANGQQDGGNATGYGSGGGGACGMGAGAATGGKGAQGLVIVEEY